MSGSERERTLFFQCSEKKQSPRHGGEMVWKKQESKSSWTLFFFLPFPPHVWDSVFFQNTEKNKVCSLSLPDIFQDQGSGYLLRGSSGTLYGVSPVKIPSKCWGWSNLLLNHHFTLILVDFSSRIQIQKQIISFQSASWLKPKSASWAGSARRCQNSSLTWIRLWKNGDIRAERDLGLGEAKISSFPNNINMYHIILNYHILTNKTKKITFLSYIL